jgi:hypothetical protein
VTAVRIAAEPRQPTGRAPFSARTCGLVAVLCAIAAGLACAVIINQVGLSGDEPYYSRIAAHPGGAHNFPYAFRIGLPYLVHVLPFSRAFSWQMLAILADGAAAGVLFALLGEFGVGARLAGGLALGFALSPPLLVVLLRNGREVDAAAILVIILGCLFIVRRQRIALALTLLVAITIHESCLFLIPFAYAYWAERLIDRAALRDVALVAVVPLALYVYLRTSIATVGRSYQPGYNGPFLTERVDVVKDALRGGAWKTELRRIALVYGPLWIAAPFALRDLRFARRGLVLFILCLGAMTFALDWGRMVFFAAPVVYVAAGYVLRNRRRLAVAAVIGLLAVDAGYAVYMQVHGVKSGLDSTGPPARGPVS